MEKVIASTKEELREAIDSNADLIEVRGNIGDKIKNVNKVKSMTDVSKLSADMSKEALASGLVGVSTAVAITLIVTVGIVTLVAILKNYNITFKDGDKEVILKRE